MSFKQDIEQYRDKNGFVLAEFRNTGGKYIDGNITLYTAQRLLFLRRLGLLDESEEIQYLPMILEQVEKFPGCLQRPYKPDEDQEHDDYIGMLFMGWILDKSICQRIKRWGIRHLWCWDNLFPEKWSLAKFFVRLPGFWAFVKACNNEWFGPLQQSLAAMDLLFTAIRDDGSSGHNMDDIKIEVYKTKSWWLYPILRAGVKLAEYIYSKNHPQGRTESYTEFFGEQHVYAKYSKEFK